MRFCLPYCIRSWLESNETVHGQDKEVLLHTPFWTFPIRLVSKSYSCSDCSEVSRVSLLICVYQLISSQKRNHLAHCVRNHFFQFYEDYMFVILPILARFKGIEREWYYARELATYLNTR